MSSDTTKEAENIVLVAGIVVLISPFLLASISYSYAEQHLVGERSFIVKCSSIVALVFWVLNIFFGPWFVLPTIILLGVPVLLFYVTGYMDSWLALYASALVLFVMLILMLSSAIEEYRIRRNLEIF